MLVLNNDHWIQLVKKNYIYSHLFQLSTDWDDHWWTGMIIMNISEKFSKLWMDTTNTDFVGGKWSFSWDAYPNGRPTRWVKSLQFYHGPIASHSRWTRALFVQKSVEISQERSRMVTWGWHYEKPKSIPWYRLKVVSQWVWYVLIRCHFSMPFLSFAGPWDGWCSNLYQPKDVWPLRKSRG